MPQKLLWEDHDFKSQLHPQNSSEIATKMTASTKTTEKQKHQKT